MTTLRGLFCVLLAGGLAGCVSMPGPMKMPSFTRTQEKGPTGPPTPVRPEAITPQNAHAQANALYDEIDYEDRKDQAEQAERLKSLEHGHSH